MSENTLLPIPHPLHWKVEPVEWKITPGEELTITAGEKTDLFIDPHGNFNIENSPCLLFKPDPAFILSAKVTVEHKYTYDAGVLILYENEHSWAKLCFELSPQGQAMIVSVVTRGVSDDCNSTAINGNTVYLRAIKKANTFAFYYSVDGATWGLVRYFTLNHPENVIIGFSSQSPTGPGCTACFAEIIYHAEELADIRGTK